jgi:hypothetical protein
MAITEIRRTTPPQAVQKIRDGVFLVQVGISASPTGDWRRLFYDAQQEVPPDFPPRSVEITGTFLRFKADPETVEQRIALLDRWMDRATQKETSMAGRSTDLQKQKREEMELEAQEIADWNKRWSSL